MSRFIAPFFDVGSGIKPSSGAKLFFFDTNTSTPKNTYSDEALTTPNTNPVISDASGLFGDIWLEGGHYKVQLEDKNSVQKWEADPVESFGVASNSSIVFETRAIAISSKKIGLGDSVVTLGYTTANDGGAATYIAEAGGVDNGFTGSLTDDGLYLNLVTGGQVDYRVTGAQVGVDSAVQLVAASNSGLDILVTGGAFQAELSTTEINDFFDNADNFTYASSMNVTVQAGLVSRTTEVIFGSSGQYNLSVSGVSTITPTITSFITSSGSAKGYLVEIGLNSVTGISVGDYALINTDITGTGDFYAAMGVWEIKAVGASSITVLNTHHGAVFPTMTLTGGAAIDILTTQVKFATSDGFRFENGDPLGLLDKMAIVGDYILATASGSVGTHGIIIGSPVVTVGGDSNEIFNANGSAGIGNKVGISAFGEQGFAASMRSAIVANRIACCSNRKRGMYSEGSHIRSKLSICSGNGEDGFISDTSGMIQASLAVACGNGLNGFFQINNSEMACSTGKATGNLQNGYECRGIGNLSADLGLALNNGADGFNATDGGMIDADSSTSDGNGDDGYSAIVGGIIDCNNSTSQNNTGFGYEARFGSVVNASGATNTGNGAEYNSTNSTLIQSTGSIYPGDWEFGITEIYNVTRSSNLQTSLTSIGDANFSIDGVARVTIKNSTGEFRASVDNTQNLGSASNRWGVVFAGNGTINTSDEREKTNCLPISNDVLDAWETVNFIEYQWITSIDEKGENARKHIGILAQDVLRKFEAKGLDATLYGLLCYDEWNDEYDGDNLVVTAGNRWGIRPDQCLFLEAALMRRELNKLK